MTGRVIVRATVALAALLAAAAFAGDAHAAGPTADTGPATAIGATTATVTGTVTPGGQSTTWYVEYGTTTGYGKKTSSTSAGSGTAATNVTVNLTGLSAGTTYHYRLVAKNGAGTSTGEDAVFTTLVPPDVVTEAASSIATTSATLNGTVDPNGRATTFYFEYGTSTSYGTKSSVRAAGSATSPQPEAVSITGLQTGRTYHFRVVATSDAGTATGKDAVFTTSSEPTVTTSDATSVTTTTATLRGSVNPNGLATTWWFEYGTTTGYGTKTSSHSAGSGTSVRNESLAISKLKPATTYHFRLVGQNSSGRVNGGDKTFATIGGPTVQTGAAQGVGPGTATLTGTLDTRGRSTTWWFDYGTTTKYGSSTSHKSAGSKAGSQTITAALSGLAPAATYHYRLVATSDGGTSYGTDASFTTTGVSLAAAARQVVFGGRIQLTGTVPTLAAGEQVIVFAEPYGTASAHSVATVLTGAGGVWAYLAKPGVSTIYQASWHGGLSPQVTINVHPRVVLTKLKSGHFVIAVSGGRTFAHKSVQLQRRVGSKWVTVKRLRLGLRSRAEFKFTLPKGRSTLRAAFSVNQAGAGFLGGTSRNLTVRR